MRIVPEGCSAVRRWSHYTWEKAVFVSRVLRGAVFCFSEPRKRD
jgi:hypothetical protein